MLKSGVYLILCRSTNDCYIGQATNIRRRIASHKWSLKIGKHHARGLQAAYDRLGPDGFSFQVLERCAESELDRKEHDWMVKVRPTYNNAIPDYLLLAKGGRSTKLHRRRQIQNREPSRYLCECGALKCVSSLHCLTCGRKKISEWQVSEIPDAQEDVMPARGVPYFPQRQSGGISEGQRELLAVLKELLGEQQYRAALLVLGAGMTPREASRVMHTTRQHVGKLLHSTYQSIEKIQNRMKTGAPTSNGRAPSLN